MNGQHIADQTLKVLQEAFEADPVAVENIIGHRVQVTNADAFYEHPTIVVQPSKDPAVPELGPLGLINGILGRLVPGCAVAGTYGEPTHEETTLGKQPPLIGFCLLQCAQQSPEKTDEDQLESELRALVQYHGSSAVRALFERITDEGSLA